MLLATGCVLDRAGVTQSGQGGQGGEGGDAPVCGDGEVNQDSELCDNGPQDTATCDEDCSLVACGDGHINQPAGESCDDGNLENGDGCNDSCVLESCGNGRLDPGEDCDDGNDSNNDDCLNNCNPPICGDGHIHNQGLATEDCDDGDGNNADNCPDGVDGTCMAATCGDGHIHTEEGGNEACDDGNSVEEDDCLNNCVMPSCGDGIVHSLGLATEECDDGAANNNNNGDCLVDCVAASCGDGYLHDQGAASEECDDADNDNGDGCSSICGREVGACCVGEGSNSCVVGPFDIGLTSLNSPIPDNGHPFGVCATVNFTELGCGNVADIDVTVGIDHTFVGDLRMELVGPNMLPQLLFNANDDGSELSANFPVTFDDEASIGADDMGTNIGGNQTICANPSSPCDYYPQPGMLSLYDGGSPLGPWEVCVSDDVDMDTGTLQSISMHITTD